VIAQLLSGLVDAFSSVQNATLENPAWSLNDPSTWDAVGVTPSESGQSVSPYTALNLGAVWQAVSTISGDVACMPLNRYRRLPDDERAIDSSSIVQYLVSTQPNDEMSAFDFWRRHMVHALLWNDAYAWIERRTRYGEPTALINLLPDRTKPARLASGELAYVTEVDGHLEVLYKEEVFHTRGISIDNACGYRLIDAARSALGLALAQQSFQSKFFANGSQMAGILEVPASMTTKAAANLEEGFRKRSTGPGNWFKTIVLRDGAKFHSVMVNPQQAQMVEQRVEQVRDIARYFNLPGFKLGLQDSVSYNSSEMAQRIYLTSCLLHWMTAITAECHLKLLSKEERRANSRYFEHNTSVLLETDFKTLNEVLEIQRRNEIINANEWRRKINLPKREDEGGEEYENPNTKSAPGAGGDEPPAKSAPAKPKPNKKTADAHRQLLASTLDRMARRVGLSARKAAKTPEKFLALVDTKAAEHRGPFSEAVAPILVAHAAVADLEASQLYQQVESGFFEPFVTAITNLANLQAGQDVFQQSVESSMDAFEKLAGQRIAGEVIGATP